jgi:hypothetical protein
MQPGLLITRIKVRASRGIPLQHNYSLIIDVKKLFHTIVMLRDGATEASGINP